MILLIVCIVIAYLIGSINTGILTCKMMGLPSPRTMGSGNPGATNVYRSGNKLAAIITLLGDALKGWLAVQMARWLHLPYTELAWIGLAAVIGHITPLYHQFKGGKGVATVLGVLIALSPLFGILALGTWIIILFLSRYSSLSAIITTLLIPFYGLMLLPKGDVLPLTLIALLVLIRHASNIYRLATGTEKRIFTKKSH